MGIPTKGILAPYISNPDHFVYFDRYELAPYLTAGENVLGFQLGNGMQNCPGGAVWQFEKAPWRSAPKLSFAVDIGAVRIAEADESVKTAPSCSNWPTVDASSTASDIPEASPWQH